MLPCYASGMKYVLAVLILAGACGDDRPWQFDAAEEVRELPMFEDVPIVRMTREEFAAEAEANAAEIDDETLQYYADTYGRLGFFARDLDLRPVLAGSSSDWVGATYSPGRKLITLVGDAADDVLVHEAVHAIQDQHFDIGAYDLSTSDGFLARRAVVEGDATLAQYRFYGEYVGQPRFGLEGWDWQRTIEARRGYAEDALVGAVYPVVFLDYVSFVYSRGFEYSIANLVGATFADPTPGLPPYDWSLQDALYTERPPSATHGILELDLQTTFEPIPIGIADVPVELIDQLELVDWDRLGRWYAYLLLFPVRDQLAFAAETVAAAWRGDRALFLRTVDGAATSTLWVSEWADTTSAAVVGDALWLLYGRTPIKDAPATRALADDGEVVHVEVRGTRLVAAKNLVPAALDVLVETAFTTDTTAAPRRRPSLPAFKLRFDFAGTR